MIFLFPYYPFYVLFLIMKKILIIRFSSIGDIVLTSPIIRCIKLQTDVELHFLTKKEYSIILESNPYIDKLVFFNTLKLTLKALRLEDYDIIIDLQNNMRSFWLKLNLRATALSVCKGNWAKFFYINFGINYLKDHVVDRYFKTVKNINVVNDCQGLEYFLGSNINIDFDVQKRFIAWSIGGTYEQKTLSKEQIIEVCNNLSIPIVLLGGDNEKAIGSQIIKESINKSIVNFCGHLSLDESAYLIQKSCLVLTNDTGLMHIAACFKKIIISFWGCTKPPLGFSPYITDEQSVQIVFQPLSRACSKHGSSCRLTEKGCVKNISANQILEVLHKSI
ncbi:MAG: glycosyl transferase [Flavobacteriales bacterium]|nr:glycosyl transferase [Flavobacteriales bacterium]